MRCRRRRRRRDVVRWKWNQQAPVWKRRAVHRVLAGAVADVEERARHLALAVEGPDAGVAAELDVAASSAAARGATAAGAALSELAAALTPGDSAQERRVSGDGPRPKPVEVGLVAAA
jgi:hypothetical protein